MSAEQSKRRRVMRHCCRRRPRARVGGRHRGREPGRHLRRRGDLCVQDQVDRRSPRPDSGHVLQERRAAAAVERSRPRRARPGLLAPRATGPTGAPPADPAARCAWPTGATGPQGPPGPVRSPRSRDEVHDRGGLWGALRVRTDDYGAVTFSCRAADRPRAQLPQLIAERDRLRPGRSRHGRVRRALQRRTRHRRPRRNRRSSSSTGPTGTEYLRVSLSGTLARRRVPRRPARRAERRARRGRAVSTRATATCSTPCPTRARSRRARSARRPTASSKGTRCPRAVADSNTVAGSLAPASERRRHPRRRDGLGVHRHRHSGSANRLG